MFYLHCNKMAFVAIIIGESKHQSAWVPNSLPQLFFFFNWKENFSFIITVACDFIKSKVCVL